MIQSFSPRWRYTLANDTGATFEVSTELSPSGEKVIREHHALYRHNTTGYVPETHNVRHDF